MKTNQIDYHDHGTLLEGYYAYNDNVPGKKPAVIVIHDWTGKNQFACKKAEKLAELGYVGFALDMFGKGKLGKTKEEKSALIKPFLDDRTLLQSRLFAALQTVQQLEMVDATNIGVIGFCFGGLCALDLARSGADVKGVVSFHGLFHDRGILPKPPIKAKVLALHGYDDPMCTPEQVAAFASEMNAANANWEIDMYGNTLHAFTNPEANDRDFGTVYNQQADNRSWTRMTAFFQEIFNG